MNAYDTVSHLVEETARIDHARCLYAKRMAQLLRGHLKHCDARDLKALKRELRDFNITTGEWKP